MPGWIYRFGPFRLEPEERRLTGGDGAVPLAPKAFDLLVVLVGNAGRLLRKEELMERLWPGVFVEEVNLAQNVSAIRRALRGTDRQAYVETVAGSGYRFVAPVTVDRDGADAAHAPGDRPPRLLVLPFRVLTPDTGIEFLSFSLADALTASLSGLETVLVRSSLTAAKYSSSAPDLDRIAREADVNLVVSGTLARARDDLRVSVQLTDAVAGTLLWSHTETGGMTDLFALQDAIVARIVGSLALPLTARERRRLRHDIPATARAYEYFLRANQASTDATAWPVARDLYLQALEEDPDYAPAWARLARVYRLLGKYRPEARDASLARAEDALRRALAINADLTMAHNLYAQVDADRGRAEAAMVRLLERAASRGADPEIFAGLVHACRYCGLLDASLAAHRRARHLDPTLPTSVMHTFFVMGRYADVLESADTIKAYVYVLSLFGVGRREEALEAVATLVRQGNRVAGMVEAAGALIEGRRADSIALLDRVFMTVGDPEARYYAARHYAHLEDRDRALGALTQAIDGGYVCYDALAADPWFDPVRSEAAFLALLARARAGQASAVAAFAAADGPRILQ